MIKVYVDNTNTFHLVIKNFREYDYTFKSYNELVILYNILSGFEYFIQSVNNGIYICITKFFPLLHQLKSYMILSFTNKGIDIVFQVYKYDINSNMIVEKFYIDFYYLRKMMEDFEYYGCKEDLELLIQNLEDNLSVEDILGSYDFNSIIKEK